MYNHVRVLENKPAVNGMNKYKNSPFTMYVIPTYYCYQIKN